jgi:hypothetical protein
MKPFTTRKQMLDAHEMMFGAAGRTCAELVVKWADTLFTKKLGALNIRVVLAPVELGPYNRHTGYHYGGNGGGTFILANRHRTAFADGTLTLTEKRTGNDTEDFIVHELTHARQAQLACAHKSERKWMVGSERGAHRSRTWYAAVAEACPKYLGFELPEEVWPTGAHTRPGTLTEVEMTHWPMSLRELRQAGDKRLR